MALVRPLPPVTPGGATGATPPPTAAPPSAFPAGSSPAFHMGPTTLPTPALQAIQNNVFGTRSVTNPGTPVGSPATVSFPGWQAQQSQIVPNPVTHAIINRLARVNNMAGWPEGWHPGWWRNPGGGGGPTGPPVPAPDPYPVGFPNLQALIDYFRGRYG